MKVVSLTPSATEIVTALGLADCLVGVTNACDYPPQVADLPRVTSTSVSTDASSAEIDRQVKAASESGTPLYRLDLARIRELAPDLVLTQGVCDVCAVGESQATTGLADLVAAPEIVALHPHRLDDVLADILRVGRAAGVPDRADHLVEEARARIGSVRNRVENRAVVDVVVLEWVDPLFSAGHWTPDLVATAGGRELLAEPGARSRELAWRELRDADPAAVVVACCGQDVPRTTTDLARLRELPGWHALRAVREGRVYVGDGGAHFSRPGPRLVDSIERLAETLHPSGRDGAPSLVEASTVTS